MRFRAGARGPRSAPIALAHRGGSLEVPENSRAALEHATALGYRYFETDVRRTADDVVVLMHDPTLERTTNGRGPVAALTWSQVALLRDGSGARPVRLDEALADYPDLRLNVDLKEDGVIGPVMRVVAEHDALDRVVFASFADARLRAVRRLTRGRARTSMGSGEVARLVLAAALPAPAAVRAATARVLGVPCPDGAGVARATCVQVPTARFGVPVVTARVVATAHELGLDVHVWTIDEAEEMDRLLDLGVDGIVSDRPTLLRDVLRRREAWGPGRAPLPH